MLGVRTADNATGTETRKMSVKTISIIVPTYNSAPFLDRLLSSIAKQGLACQVIVNDDPRTDDATDAVVERFAGKGMGVSLLKENPSRALARNSAARRASGEYLLMVDSDMELGDGLLAECSRKASEGYDALVIPEESFGPTFWARCRWLEKKYYEGVEEIEALRFVKAEIFYEIGGYSEGFAFGEDKDLDLRVRRTGCVVGRTETYLYHNEGALKLVEAARKKAYYGRTAQLYAEKQPDACAWEMNPAKRYLIFLRHRHHILDHPLLYAGLIILKTAEFGAAGVAHLLCRLRPSRAI